MAPNLSVPIDVLQVLSGCDDRKIPVLPLGRLTDISGLLKNAYLLRSPHPSSLRRTARYASLLRISGALHLSIFEQPSEKWFFAKR
jgi:hypothetical protein